jgi:hypothetical protein
MSEYRSSVRAAGAILLALCVAAPASRVAAQAPSASPATPSKSVYGKLAAVDKSLNGVVMMSEAGKRLAWRLPAAVIAEMDRFKRGDPMIVIYRQIAPTDKRVTAVAFPGTAATPTYVNTTDGRVVLRGAPMVNGACGAPDAGPVTESTIPRGGSTEVMEACWCCAVVGESCRPGNKTGNGRALLVSCFE